MKKKDFVSLGVILFLVFTLVFSLDLVKKTQVFLSEALGDPADIIVDASFNQGPIAPFWQSLAQGGEEKEPFKNIPSELAELKPAYIRIDHLYDFYDVVSRGEDGRLKYNWTQLDSVVDDILKAGAKPFFSLSYMPAAISSGEVTDPPAEWGQWQEVVQKTIEQYSGRQGKNLENVYYEVWNEPDLFGQWKIDSRKDYRLLYAYASRGASQAQNVRPFKIGGPATTAPYNNWIKNFLGYVRENNLRVDFYSWHRYSQDPKKFLEDINQVDDLLFKSRGGLLEKVLSEWGSDAELSPNHDSSFDAAHLVAVTRQLIQRLDWAFIFEVKDGPSASGQKFWGRWGLLTHEAAGQVEKKPKFFALKLLNQMGGERLRLAGEGSWVSGFAAKDGAKIKIILVNFDREERHSELVPLTIKNLEAGNYFYQQEFLLGLTKSSNEVVTEGQLKKEIFLSPNNIVLVELEKR